MVLLIVDTQVGITDERLSGFEALKENIKSLIAAARENGREVIYVCHDDGPGTGFSVGDEEFAVFPEFAPLPGEKLFVKTVNSALHSSVGLSDYLRAMDEKQVMVVGLQTDLCIDATIKTGFDMNLEMIVPEGAFSTFDNAYLPGELCCRYFYEYIWKDRYARCVSMVQALELLKK